MASQAAKRSKVDVEQAPLGAEAEGAAINEQLQKVRQDLDKLNEEASDKVLEIEQQYSKLRRPIYDKRNEILSSIPGFWQTTFMHHQELRDAATEDDTTILGYCTEVNVEDFEDIKSGYQIVFRFSDANPYFSNSELVKTFRYQEGGTLRVESTKPEWKEGFEPADDDVDGKRGRGDHEYNLFSWFMTEDTVMLPNSTDEIAEIIKEEIWPDPAKYYEVDFSEGEGEEGEGEEGMEGEEFEGNAFEEEGEDEEGLPEDEGEEAFEGEEGDE